jgi:hypothetical protein
MSLFHSVSDLIGHTPLLQLHKLDTGPCSLFLKLENQNPGGSIKDRVALSMINEAERQGKLAPGGTIIEATAGNTGLGLALIAAQKNYRLILVVPDKMSREKIFHLRALGATVLLTRSDVNKGHPAYYQDYARRLADETPGAFISTSLTTTLIRWRTRPPPRRNPAAGGRHRRHRRRRWLWRHAGRASGLVCRTLAENGIYPRRSGGLDPCRSG